VRTASVVARFAAARIAEPGTAAAASAVQASAVRSAAAAVGWAARTAAMPAADIAAAGAPERPAVGSSTAAPDAAADHSLEIAARCFRRSEADRSAYFAGTPGAALAVHRCPATRTGSNHRDRSAAPFDSSAAAMDSARSASAGRCGAPYSDCQLRSRSVPRAAAADSPRAFRPVLPERRSAGIRRYLHRALDSANSVRPAVCRTAVRHLASLHSARHPGAAPAPAADAGKTPCSRSVDGSSSACR